MQPLSNINFGILQLLVSVKSTYRVHPQTDIDNYGVFNCEATLDNTQNVPPSLPVKEFDASSPPRYLKFFTELKFCIEELIL